MAHFHIKTKKGRPYLYVREIARVDGKPKVISQIYLGSPEKVAGLLGGKEAEVLDLKVEEFGSLWLAQQIDRDIDLCGIIDNVVPRAERETGPSIGEYFLYCVLNRMVQAVSKNKLADWYPEDRHPAYPARRSGRTDQQALLGEMGPGERNRSADDCPPVFRAYLASRSRRPPIACSSTPPITTPIWPVKPTRNLPSEGKNKAGKHHLRQIGLGLLVARDSRLPLYYSVYPGNTHDSKHFEAVMDEMFGVVCGLDKTKERLTVVIDKGMNADANYAWIDDHPRMHFITTYSTYFAQELAATPLDRFEPADTAENRRYIEEGQEEECLLVYRTRGEYWGKERTVLVTHTPASARKQAYTFADKLEAMRQELLAMRAKVRDKAPQWRKEEAIRERYVRFCEQIHMDSQLYELEFGQSPDGLSLTFRKNVYLVEPETGDVREKHHHHRQYGLADRRYHRSKSCPLAG